MFYTRGYIINDPFVKKIRDMYAEQNKVEPIEENWSIQHKQTKEILSTHDSETSAKDEHSGLGKDKNNYVVKKGGISKKFSVKEEVEDDLDEGYKVGDMVNVTNPKAKPQYKIVGKTKTHYEVEKPSGDRMHMPKERVARVNKERFDRLRAAVSPKRLKGSDIPKKAVNEEIEEIQEKFAVYRKGGSIGDKPATSPHGSHVETHDTEDAAKAHAKRMNGNLSPGEKTYYRIKYHVKPIKEEVEQIEELSKKTLGSYVNKALKDTASSSRLEGSSRVRKQEAASKDTADYHGENEKHYEKVANKRMKGISTATKKLTKEEVEQIEELSKKTLGSYVSKAADDYTHHSGEEKTYKKKVNMYQKLGDRSMKDYFKKHADESGKNAGKRSKGLNVAVKKLTKEEVEAIESTLSSMDEAYMPHPYRQDLHRVTSVNGGLDIHKHTSGSTDKPVKMGFVNTSKGSGNYSAHDENGKEVSSGHADIAGAMRSIAVHHTKNGNAKKFNL